MRRESLIVVIAFFASTFSTRAAEPASKDGATKDEIKAFHARLMAAATKHLNALIDRDGKVSSLKGKSADGMEALSFYLMYEMTANPRYRTAGVQLADRILKDMRAMKFGVLFIREKEKNTGEKIAGGGPPALGFYTASAAYVCYKEGKRGDDLKYIGNVLDAFPWNEEGWWATTIDVKTGIPKVPLSHESAINKNAAMVMSAGMVSAYLKDIDPNLSDRLKKKADRSIYKQIIPAQEKDGFWHYGLSGNDPKNKDVLGYFMLSTNALLQVQLLTDSYHDPAFLDALKKAGAFALRDIAPMTDPNKGLRSKRTTLATPAHFSVSEDDDPKRGFSLGMTLMGSKNYKEAFKIMDHWLKAFPYGNGGQSGAHAMHPTTFMLLMLQNELGVAPKQ